MGVVLLSYILTCIDHFTRWPEVQPIPDMTVQTVALAFINVWIAHFGVPSMVTINRGQQMNQCCRETLQLLGCKCIHTTCYHTIADGMIEHLHHPF